MSDTKLDVVEPTETPVVEEKTPELNEYEKASVMLANGFKSFARIVDPVSQKKTMRVVRKLIFEPLEDVDLIHKDEKALYNFLKDMLYYKHKVVEYVITEREKNKEGKKNE